MPFRSGGTQSQERVCVRGLCVNVASFGRTRWAADGERCGPHGWRLGAWGRRRCGNGWRRWWGGWRRSAGRMGGAAAWRGECSDDAGCRNGSWRRATNESGARIWWCGRAAPACGSARCCKDFLLSACCAYLASAFGAGRAAPRSRSSCVLCQTRSYIELSAATRECGWMP